MAAQIDAALGLGKRPATEPVAEARSKRPRTDRGQALSGMAPSSAEGAAQGPGSRQAAGVTLPRPGGAGPTGGPATSGSRPPIAPRQPTPAAAQGSSSSERAAPSTGGEGSLVPVNRRLLRVKRSSRSSTVVDPDGTPLAMVVESGEQESTTGAVAEPVLASGGAEDQVEPPAGAMDADAILPVGAPADLAAAGQSEAAAGVAASQSEAAGREEAAPAEGGATEVVADQAAVAPEEAAGSTAGPAEAAVEMESAADPARVAAGTEATVDPAGVAAQTAVDLTEVDAEAERAADPTGVAAGTPGRADAEPPASSGTLAVMEQGRPEPSGPPPESSEVVLAQNTPIGLPAPSLDHGASSHATDPSPTQLQSLANVFGFNVDEFADSLTAPSTEVPVNTLTLTPELKVKLQEILIGLEKPIEELLQNAELIRSVFLPIRDDLQRVAPELLVSINPMAFFESYSEEWGKASAALAKREQQSKILQNLSSTGNRSRQEKLKLDDLQNKPASIDSELSTLLAREEELKKALADVQSAIARKQTERALLPSLIEAQRARVKETVQEGLSLQAQLVEIPVSKEIEEEVLKTIRLIRDYAIQSVKLSLQ